MFKINLLENWKKPWVVAGLILLFVIICIKIFKNTAPSTEDIEDAESYCFYSDKMKSLVIDGVITEKFHDKKMHLFPAFKFGRKKDQIVHPIGESSGFYDSLRVGDSLFKPSGTLEVKIFRDTSLIRWQLRYLDCE